MTMPNHPTFRMRLQIQQSIQRATAPAVRATLDPPRSAAAELIGPIDSALGRLP